jgi:Glycosyl hydrolase family 53
MLRRLVLLSVAAALLLPATAQAKRQVPFGWLGVVADGPLTDGMADSGAEWDRLAGSGAESVRVGVRWAPAQPSAGAAPQLAAVDATVLAAAARGLTVLPVVQDTPGWAALDPGAGTTSPPRDPADLAAFLRALAARYGPAGTLWAEHPEVRRVPVRRWQIWNEPNLTRYWSEQPFAARFVRVLRAGRRALREVDRGAQVVLAGLPNRSWTALESIYKAGGRGTFDVVALHPYTGQPKNVVRLVTYARRVMRRHHDARMPVWVTELSWPAAEGKVQGTPGFETTERGQAARLREALKRLAAERRRLRIGAVYWYTWLSAEGTGSAFTWSGLRRLRGGAVFSARSLAVYANAAKRLEGCAKRPGDARRCR